LAETDNPATWVNFETAVRTYLDYGCDGIGICRTGDLIFGELDGVIDAEGHIRSFPWAQKFLTAMRGRAYVESSPTRTGIHAICRGILPPGRREFDEPGQIHTGFALYDKSRYFTVIGHVLTESGNIQDLTQVLERLHKELFPTQKSNGTAHPPRSSEPAMSLNDAELLAKARRAANGNAFSNLFDHGAWEGRYPSESEADLALCNHLAFWTGCDPIQMDRLFRQSALFDSKWDQRADYRQRTIELACSGVNSTYDPRYQPQESTVNGSESNTPPRSASSAAGAATESPSPLPSSPPPPSEPDPEQPEVSPSRRRRLICVRPPYRSLVPQALRALHDLNQDSPKLFLQRGLPMQVVSDETGRYFIRPITPEAMVGYLDQAANFCIWRKKLVTIFPPKGLAVQIQSWSPADLGFLPLAGIASLPMFRKDGSILLAPGYDPETGLYAAFGPSLSGLQLPFDMTLDDVNRAKECLCVELLGDFCFAEPVATYKANTLGVLLTFVLLWVIDSALPILLIDAVIRGSGKSLLSMIIGLVVLGQTPPMTTAPEPREAGEWRKRITAFLLEGSAMVVVDNAKFSIESAELCAAVTSPTFCDRLLGTNTSVEVISRCLWVFTGNALHPVGDIVRRCFWIRLDPKTSAPERRAGFRHPDLMGWVLEHRADLIRSLLILGRWWFLSGSPLSTTVPACGNFTRWAQVVGGVLESAGIPGFLGVSETYVDPEIDEWTVFLSVVDEVTRTPFTVRELVAITHAVTLNPETGQNEPTEHNKKLRGAMPEELSESLDRPELTTSLSVAFRQRKGRYYGDEGIHIEKTDKRVHGAVVWEIKRIGDAEDEGRTAQTAADDHEDGGEEGMEEV
jgi:hypothetical protein